MIKRYKSGFSLVEVMLLLLVLSLIISASIPMITKRNLAIPQKAIHGIYLCIANPDGTFYTARYNSKKVISEKKNALACDEFIPPKSAGLFNIYLYGAGAGGYNSFSVSSEEYARSANYNMGDGKLPSFGNHIYAVTDDDIGNAFRGKTVYLSAELPSAYSGGDITALMHANSNVHCARYRNDGRIEDTKSISGYNYQNNVRGYSLLSDNDRKEIYDKCILQYEEDMTDCLNFDCGATNGFTRIRLYGGEGGDTSYMNYSYDIPEIESGGSWVNWLQELESYHSDGDLHYKEYGRSGKDTNCGEYPTGTCSGEIGKDPDYTATISSYFDTVQNIYSATNGKPASIDISDSSITAETPENGESAAEQSSSCKYISGNYGNCSLSSSSESGIPYFKLTSKNYEHTHTLGMAGKQGDTKKVTIKKLPSPCNFTVSKGGDVVQSGGTSYSLPATTIVCGSNCNTTGNCYFLSAESGTPNLSTVSQTFPYPSDAQPYTITDEAYSKVQTQEVDFNKFSAWYKLSNSSPLPGVGYGGNGPIIIDNCTGIYGTLTGKTIWSGNISGSDTSLEESKKEDTCKLPENSTNQDSGKWNIQTEAQPGGGGAVMIVW